MTEDPTTHPSRRDPEAGFTLIEVLISVVILGLITAALSAAFVTALNISRPSAERLHESNDAQRIAAFLVRDAQAAGGTDPFTGAADDPTLGVSTTNVSVDGVACTNTTNLLLAFKWIDQAANTRNAAVYSYDPAAKTVVRTSCSGTNLATVRPLTLGTHIASAPTVTCTTNNAPVACSTGAQPTTRPDKVSLDVTETNNPQISPTAYRYTLTASLRSQVQPGATTNNSPAAPMLLLGGGSGCSQPGLTGTGNPSLDIAGFAAINNCPASTLGGSASASSSDITYVVAPATCANIDGPCSVVTQPFEDPYAAAIASGLLTPPSTAGCTGGSNPGPVSPNHYGPSTYPQLLNANNVTLDPGTYVFCNGLNISGTVTGDNVTLYFAGGTVNIGNGSSLSLSKPTSGPYAAGKLTVWQAQGNSAPPTTCCSNNASTIVNIFGTLYAPSAVVSFKNGTVHIDQVVALGLNLAQANGSTTIGDSPEVLSTSPSSRGQGAANQVITIIGKNFISGGSLASSFGAGITVNSTTFVDSTHLTANITIANNAAVGPRDVTVTSGNGRTGVGHNVFTVNAAPVVTSTNPSSRGRGLTSQNIVITGSGFASGAGLAASFSGNGITVNSTTFNSSTQVTANIDIASGATLGSRNVTVTNPDGGSGTANNAFAIVAPTITSVTLGNGGNTPGTIQKDDTITIVFSSQMSESSICSTWTPDTNDQSLSAAGNVVTVTDGGAGNDTITVSATACILHFGTIDLGSTGYVTGGNASFGSGGNKTMFAWNATTHTLTITLGTKSGAGTLQNVSSSAPSYSASPAITDSGGAGLTNSPFALANAKQF
jgi:prepilin-type N-terminal cleavage/methylation domain-containing protein